uniref:Uncharacterized protein n=1 Tax=Chromera velia CCMP2878 TaxID=1169474 RepID=A0A0K6SAM1_9ALVE|eukprot:Cvel_10926.t2-p1 / transcript=Cvel_10926.t2 / gene=Cvel_10926 / organism=Chromera_velia_CCMP2878 / gene_product=hypothetical protein / transcript_product=hypothetical protein / location=Cvel_scaffold671:55467-56146(+) / protein_length=181 / sequence_SO=supercontig / SO=protein_coding / is_pseudo=false
MLRDLLHLSEVKEEWKVAPLVDPEEELPDEMKSIFDGNVYRTHPLEIKSSTGRWCSDRRKWSAAVVTDEWERENSGRAEARVQQEEGIGEEEDEGEEEDPFSFGGDNSDWAWFNPDDDGASPSASAQALPKGSLESQLDAKLLQQVAEGRVLEEKWVFFRMVNDDATLQDPLKANVIKSLQ